MSEFLHGAISMASLAVAFFFVRYWRSSGDRLYAMFGGAFALLSIHWCVSGTLPHLTTHAHLLRFLAFALIAVAVLDKNRQGRGRTPSWGSSEPKSQRD